MPRIFFRIRVFPAQGSALFLILIAVALFAALSYAVTRSGRGSGDIGKEQQALVLSALTQHFAEISHATKRLILTGGCSVETVRFWHTFPAKQGN